MSFERIEEWCDTEGCDETIFRFVASENFATHVKKYRPDENLEENDIVLACRNRHFDDIYLCFGF